MRVDHARAETLMDEFKRFLYEPLQEMEGFEEDYIRLGNLRK